MTDEFCECGHEKEKHKCEQCEKELTDGALFDLIKDDWVYHRYCKDCIGPQVKAIFEKLGIPDLILDEHDIK